MSNFRGHRGQFGPRVKCGCADVESGEMRIKTADTKFGCVGGHTKTTGQMTGQLER